LKGRTKLRAAFFDSAGFAYRMVYGLACAKGSGPEYMQLKTVTGETPEDRLAELGLSLPSQTT